MALNDEDLMQFSKSTELIVTLIEDESTGATPQNPTGTVVKVLHLQAPVNAVGSIPAPGGGEMRVSGAKVYVASENWKKFLADANKKDNVIYYKGDMHLDVSKPNGRTVNGQFVVTKPAKIWLTAIKFSKSGGALSQDRVNTLNNLIDGMFAGNKTFNLATETAGVATGAPVTGAAGGDVIEPEPVVIDKAAAKNGSAEVLETAGAGGKKK